MPLATGFGVRVTVLLVVILQRLLKADRAQWFPGNAVESGTSNLSEECKRAKKHCGGLKAISLVHYLPRSQIEYVCKAKQRKIFDTKLTEKVT